MNNAIIVYTDKLEVNINLKKKSKTQKYFTNICCTFVALKVYLNFVQFNKENAL